MHDADVWRGGRHRNVGRQFFRQHHAELIFVCDKNARSIRVFEKPLGNVTHGLRVGGREITRSQIWQTVRGDDDAAGLGKFLQRQHRGDRDALDIRQNHGAIMHVAERKRVAGNFTAHGEQLIVKEIKIVTRIGDRADGAGRISCQRGIHAEVAPETRPRIAVRQE